MGIKDLFGRSRTTPMAMDYSSAQQADIRRQNARKEMLDAENRAYETQTENTSMKRELQELRKKLKSKDEALALVGSFAADLLLRQEATDELLKELRSIPREQLASHPMFTTDDNMSSFRFSRFLELKDDPENRARLLKKIRSNMVEDDFYEPLVRPGELG